MQYPNDERLQKVETITIDWDTFKKTLRREYLEHNQYTDRNFVLRLTPPFESEMEAKYYESMNGQYYNNEWNEKPFHIRPQMVLLEGTEKSTQPFRWAEWPTERTVRDNLTESDIEEIGGIDEALQECRDWFWNELQSFLPDTYDLGKSSDSPVNYEVDIEWQNIDE
jgi:hypothetical protein